MSEKITNEKLKTKLKEYMTHKVDCVKLNDLHYKYSGNLLPDDFRIRECTCGLDKWFDELKSRMENENGQN